MVDVVPGQENTSSAGDAMPSIAATEQPADRFPRVWGDVPQRNPNFTGREALLAKLHEGLLATRETAVLPQALHGMGGVGKSQIAIEYVHRHSKEYDLIWWVPAEQPEQVLASLTKLAQRLHLGVGPDGSGAMAALREALSTEALPYQNWLLVFDNAEALPEVRTFFPTGGAGNILVTSRNPDWVRVAKALEVDVFARDESKAFLTRRAPGLRDADADRLAEALGDLPLALEQAAAWRAHTGMPVDDYLRLLANKRMELFEDSPSPDYQVSVAAAWSVSLDKLAEVNPAALQLLQVCSFLAPAPISRSLFSKSPAVPIASALDDALADPISLSRAIRYIHLFALAKLDHQNNTLQMHRLVQAVLIGRMDEEQRAVMHRGARALLANADPDSPSNFRPGEHADPVDHPTDFFVSYTSADEQWAEWISHVLEDAGYTVVVQAWDFLTGNNYVLKVDGALRSSNRLIVVLSPDYLAARHPQPEWAAVFATDPEGARRRLVPVMVRACQPKGLLGQIVQIRIHDLERSAAAQRLLDGVKDDRFKPANPPVFPGITRPIAGTT